MINPKDFRRFARASLSYFVQIEMSFRARNEIYWAVCEPRTFDFDGRILLLGTAISSLVSARKMMSFGTRKASFSGLCLSSYRGVFHSWL